MKKVRFASHLKAKVRHHGPPCYARAQPWLVIHVFNNNNYCGIQTTCTVILLQIVMVSPGTHLLKNHESLLSITNESQFKKTRNPIKNWKCLGLYVTRELIWRQMPKLFGDTLFTLQFTEIKMYSPSIYLKHKEDKQICIFKQQPQNHTDRI